MGEAVRGGRTQASKFRHYAKFWGWKTSATVREKSFRKRLLRLGRISSSGRSITPLRKSTSTATSSSSWNLLGEVLIEKYKAWALGSRRKNIPNARKRPEHRIIK